MAEAGPARLILASASPRRRELLGLLDQPFEVVVAAVDERPRPDESPEELVTRLAMDKACAVSPDSPAIVIGADTVVVSGDGDVLGKPTDDTEAASMLRSLSGRSHRVVTGVAVVDHTGRSEVFVESTIVRMRELHDHEIVDYVATGEPLDKAGAYAIQGLGGRFVTGIDGSYHNVVGLPVAQLEAVLRRFGG